jgi:glycosyltransferase involved in cell wall biosynthesis
MAPDEIEWFKLDRDDDAGARAEGRTQIELDLGRTAARVIAVGPRLHNRYQRDLHPYNVPSPLRLDPGFDTQSVDLRNPPPGAPWTILVLGRLEDDRLKGLDLAAKAVGLAASRREPGAKALELEVRGAPHNTSTELKGKLCDWSGYPALSVVVRPFTTDTESLDADVKSASLLLMPSRSEGFGLVGLEAIVAGTPVLVSSESGLGAMLREALEHEQAGRIVVPMSGDDDEDGERWGRAVEGMLRDREAAFRRAMEVRALLATRKTWAAAVAGLLAELHELRGAPSAQA